MIIILIWSLFLSVLTLFDFWISSLDRVEWDLSPTIFLTYDSKTPNFSNFSNCYFLKPYSQTIHFMRFYLKSHFLFVKSLCQTNSLALFSNVWVQTSHYWKRRFLHNTRHMSVTHVSGTYHIGHTPCILCYACVVQFCCAPIITFTKNKESSIESMFKLKTSYMIRCDVKS